MSSSTTNNTCIVYGSDCTSPINLPSFIDEQACLCGLLQSRSTLPDNGEYVELWRCIGNASESIIEGGNGKWYNTSLPSQELAGLNKPQNWGENPPDVSQAYELLEENGQVVYEKLGSQSYPNLIGSDKDCTGTNDTSLSKMYYARGKGAPKPSSSSSSASVTPTANSGSETTSTTPTVNSGIETTSTTPSPSATTMAAAAPKGNDKSAAKQEVSFKSTFLIGIMLAPLVGLLIR